MNRVVLLDAGPLGLLAHPRANRNIAGWANALVAAGDSILVAAIADYEVRRELLRMGRAESIARLDALKSVLGYLALTELALLRAAEYWATSRQQGQPTADDKALDADVILAAQATTLDAGTACTFWSRRAMWGASVGPAGLCWLCDGSRRIFLYLPALPWLNAPTAQPRGNRPRDP